jgi:hypothetical protein
MGHRGSGNLSQQAVKGMRWAIAAVILVGVAAAGGWYFVLREEPMTPPEAHAILGTFIGQRVAAERCDEAMGTNGEYGALHDAIAARWQHKIEQADRVRLAAYREKLGPGADAAVERAMLRLIEQVKQRPLSAAACRRYLEELRFREHAGWEYFERKWGQR